MVQVNKETSRNSFTNRQVDEWNRLKSQILRANTINALTEGYVDFRVRMTEDIRCAGTVVCMELAFCEHPPCVLCCYVTRR